MSFLFDPGAHIHYNSTDQDKTRLGALHMYNGFIHTFIETGQSRNKWSIISEFPQQNHKEAEV